MCAQQRAPSPGLRVRVSAGCRYPWVPARRSELVRTRGPRSPGAAAAAVSSRLGPERGAPRLPSPALRRAPAQLGLGCGEAPPPPRSQAGGRREASDHRLPPAHFAGWGWGTGQWAPGGGVRPGMGWSGTPPAAHGSKSFGWETWGRGCGGNNSPL